MSRLITFYSYKGGVGRTFALANTAVLLAQSGHRVLAIDWDLEAPGLHRYFDGRIDVANSGGLIHLLMSAAVDKTTEWQQFVSQVSLKASGHLDLLCSGDHCEDYAQAVRSFSWNDFIHKHKRGQALEDWRREWKATYDYVLIDSRTGITDSGGVCTVVLPDILVLVFGANRQSFDRGMDVVAGVQSERLAFGLPRPPLAILPLPGRFDGRDEVEDAAKWLDRFAERCKSLYDVWLPAEFSAREMLEVTKIPYVAKFSFGEPLPILTHGVTDPDGPGFYLNNIARLLRSDFADARRILAPERASESESQPLREAKLVVVGNGGVGKTSLIRALSHRSFDPATSVTHGIEVNRWTVDIRAEELGDGALPGDEGDTEVRLNVWDFGGQEVMHATHQFFMTRRSLYLLVVDSRAPGRNGAIDYWLKLIKSLAGDSPVIIVCNKADTGLMRLDKAGIVAKFPTVVAFVETSCLDGRGIDTLRREVAHAASRLDSLDVMFPMNWFATKKRLESITRDCIDFGEYQDVCREYGIGEREQRALIVLERRCHPAGSHAAVP